MEKIEGYSPLLSYVKDYTSTYQQDGLKFKLSSDCVHKLNSFLPAVARFVFRLLSDKISVLSRSCSFLFLGLTAELHARKKRARPRRIQINDAPRQEYIFTGL